MSLKVEWVDDHREPRHPPNPRYPDGIDLDIAGPSEAPSCFTYLRPYPTPRCGYFVVSCETCGLKAIVSTAGRPDDPRSLRVRCKLN
jgi:hypothetical protein